MGVLVSGRHCAICDRPIAEGRTVCSPECFRTYMSIFRQRANVTREILTNFQPRRASWATRARPGSPQKIAVLRWRYEHGEELFHPQDVTLLDAD